jgi:DNA helicase-2/ATP-dependent DNA helicase PcrA
MKILWRLGKEAIRYKTLYIIAILSTFANSDMKLFKEFCEEEGTQVFKIVNSSRNTKQIINLANGFVKYVREQHPTPECRESLLPQYIEPADAGDLFPNPVIEGQSVFTDVFKKREDEYEYIAKKCRELIKINSNKTIAVLIPSKWKIDIFLKILENNKIECEYLDSFAGERNKTLVLLGRILDFVGLPEKNEKLIELIKILIEEETEGKELLINYLSKVSTEELFYPLSGEISLKNLDKALIDSKAWKEFLKIRIMLKDFLEFPFTMVEKLVLYIGERLNFSTENMAIIQKVASTVRFLITEEPRYKITDLANELLSQKSMFNYFANLVWELKGYEAKPGIVTVATYHKSKGLEWDNVFLADLDNDDFPTELTDKFKDEFDYLKEACSNPSRMLKEDMKRILGEDHKQDFAKQAKIEVISERARLLYVGVTRAKERVFITTVKGGRSKASPYFEIIDNLRKEVSNDNP